MYYTPLWAYVIMVLYQLDLIWNRLLNNPFLIFKLAIKLFSNNCPYFLNLKAKYGYIFFCCLLNYFSVMHNCIKIRLICKILIVATPKLTKKILDQVTMLFYSDDYFAGGSNIEYVCFNLLELLFIASSTNSDGCYLLVITKISNFLYSIQYLLFKIISRKIILPSKSKHLLSCLFFSASNSFDLQYW